MLKVFAWFKSIKKLSAIIKAVQKFLSGKKAYISGVGLIIPALVDILTKFSDQGISYLVGVTSTSEWALLLNGIGVMGIRAAITKAADPAKDPNKQS